MAEAFSPRTLLTLMDGHAQHTQNQPTHHAAGTRICPISIVPRTEPGDMGVGLEGGATITPD